MWVGKEPSLWQVAKKSANTPWKIHNIMTAILLRSSLYVIYDTWLVTFLFSFPDSCALWLHWRICCGATSVTNEIYINAVNETRGYIKVTKVIVYLKRLNQGPIKVLSPNCTPFFEFSDVALLQISRKEETYVINFIQRSIKASSIAHD